MYRHLPSPLLLLITVWLATGCGLLGEDPVSTVSPPEMSQVDDSEVPDSLRALYREDAAELTLRLVHESVDPREQSVTLPPDWIESFYHALISVYEARDQAGEDAGLIATIHTGPNFRLHEIIASVDSSADWVQAWRRGDVPTGNPEIDRLIDTYNLRLRSVSPNLPGDVVVIRSETPLNTSALIEEFEGITGVVYAEPNGAIGGGNDIQAEVTADYIELTYSLGWGDCPAGCISRALWTFRVSPNGRVEYRGRTGDPLPPGFGPHTTET